MHITISTGIIYRPRNTLATPAKAFVEVLPGARVCTAVSGLHRTHLICNPVTTPRLPHLIHGATATAHLPDLICNGPTIRSLSLLRCLAGGGGGVKSLGRLLGGMPIPLLLRTPRRRRTVRAQCVCVCERERE